MILRIVALLVALFTAAGLQATPASPKKPPARVVDEVSAFLLSDVGRYGIRTNDGDPEGYPVPPYFYHYAIHDWGGLPSSTTGYPGYASVSYPGYTASVGIDAFLAWRLWSGDAEGLARAVAFADWILEHRTPAADLYGNLPYSTQTDAVMGGGWDGEAIMTDKPAMFGLRLLRLHAITGEQRFLDGALEIGATLRATQITSADPAEDGRWPFRVRPSDGLVTHDYTSHLTPAVRFFDALYALSGDPVDAAARDRAWSWLLANPLDPASPSYQRWEAFYEDQAPEEQIGEQDHYSAHETIVELLRRRPPGWQASAVAVMDDVRARYLVAGPNDGYGDYYPCTREWIGWPIATFASTLQFAYTARLLGDALDGGPYADPSLAELAAGMVIVSTYGQNTRDGADDGRMYTTVRDIENRYNLSSWYEQDFNTVKYLLALMALDPSLAPDGEDHILATATELTQLAYPAPGVLPVLAYTAAPGAAAETIKLFARPFAVRREGADLRELPSDDGVSTGWSWDEAAHVLRTRHPGGAIELDLDRSTAVPAAAVRPALRGLSGGRLALALAAPARVDVELFDLRGRRVRILADGAAAPAGETVLAWDGRDDAGRRAPGGLYVARARAAGQTATARLLLVR